MLTAQCALTTAPWWMCQACAGLKRGVLTMADFYFAIGPDPRYVFVVVNGNWIPYKRCETEAAAKALVIGQNKSRGGKP